MKKKFVIAIKAGNKPFGVVEIVMPEREFDTPEEAEKDIEGLFASDQNAMSKFYVLPQYTKE